MSRARNAAAAAVAETSPVFAALGDSTRLTLVVRLCAEGPLSIARLSEGTDISRQAVTKHLDRLAGAGLVHDRWVGRERVFELETKRLERARRYLDQISDQWDAVIDRLQAFIEKG